ncbi:MAG: UDP diphospho-muramoyl pentapeptide beta-N acetylglucosaminyl transferase [Parcubacteria group bacterium Gr01-1014_72]|nr:MAG: UDP diphospho-muramoyl pentapeptide beta-N acetylglucosaminyl transferase [Parcubacteria group bacterium Gr01-1014_72]
MKILLTGGGSGGHFYPLIAVAEQIERVVRERHLLQPKFYYMSSDEYDARLLFERNITFLRVSAGKFRRYFSPLIIIDTCRVVFGVVKAFWKVYSIFPDIVFSKGGYASLPAVVAAWLLRIPLVIHESDSVPGAVNRWSGKFALRIALSYADAALYFPREKVAHTGNPVRQDISLPQKSGAREFLGLEEGVPVILILGGSQGAARINDTVLDILPKLVERYQVIHQTGKVHLAEMKGTTGLVLKDSPHRNRYHAFDYLSASALRMAAGAAELVISRAGSTIFEIALWGIPSIIIPIEGGAGDHQRKNAFTYAHAGACVVLEETNLTPSLLLSEIDRLFANRGELAQLGENAKKFARPDAARVIAEEILAIALEHEK